MINNSLDINDILYSLCPTAQWQIFGSTIEWEEAVDENNQPTGELVPTNLNWFTPEVPVPTHEQINARMHELQAIRDSLEYQKLRALEYPPLTDLADALFWQANGDESKMTAYLQQVASVKNRYPKGTV
jgi:hypothetical protein